MDTGLVNYAAGLQADVFSTPEIDNVFNGKIAEHITGQELLSLNQSPLYKLNFWTRENNGTAELDFVYQYKNLLIPIEVKSGTQGIY